MKEITKKEQPKNLISEEDKIRNLKNAYINEKLEISESELTKLIGKFKIDKTLEIGNFEIKKKSKLMSLIKSEQIYKLDVLDYDNDLNNLPIISNKKFIKFLYDKCRKNNSEIHEDELKKFEIPHLITGYTIGNISLNARKNTQFYDVDIIDENKDYEGRCNDGYFDLDNVINAIDNFKLKKSDYEYYKETEINELLENHLKKYFVNAHRSSGKTKKIFDLVIGNDEIIIEIKLAKSLTSAQSQRAIGQIQDYLELGKYNEFLLLVIGLKSQRQDKFVKELEQKIDNMEDCEFYFHQI